jgi:hypothetical protein
VVVGTGYAYERLLVTAASENSGSPGSARLLTKQDYHLVGAFGGGFMDWSPDYRKIVFAHMPRPRFDDWRKLDIGEVGVESAIPCSDGNGCVRAHRAVLAGRTVDRVPGKRHSAPPGASISG